MQGEADASQKQFGTQLLVVERECDSGGFYHQFPPLRKMEGWDPLQGWERVGSLAARTAWFEDRTEGMGVAEGWGAERGHEFTHSWIILCMNHMFMETLCDERSSVPPLLYPAYFSPVRAYAQAATVRNSRATPPPLKHSLNTLTPALVHQEWGGTA